MSNTRVVVTLSAAALCTLTAVAPARAQFVVTWDNGGNFVFAPSTRTPGSNGLKSEGDLRNLTGTIRYTGTQTVYSFGAGVNALDNVSRNTINYQNNTFVAGPYASDALNAWASNASGLRTGASFTGTLTELYIDNSTANGFYDRDGFGVVGNGGSMFFGLYSDAARTNSIGNSSPTAGVTVQIGSVAAPEASTALLVLPGLLFFARRRK